MSSLARTAVLTAIWILGTLAAGVLLLVGVVTLSDAALRVAFAVLAAVTVVASLLLFQSPQPVTPQQESRLSAHVRTTAQLRASLR